MVILDPPIKLQGPVSFYVLGANPCWICYCNGHVYEVI